jgi:hypothetical protein
MRRADHVDVERSDPVFVGRIDDPTEQGVERRDLHEAVNRAKALDRAAHQRRALIRVGDIGGDRGRALARRIYLACQRGQSIGAARREHYVGAVAQRDRHTLPAEARADSGYNDGLSFKNHGRGL